jgi:hypothetical protein
MHVLFCQPIVLFEQYIDCQYSWHQTAIHRLEYISIAILFTYFNQFVSSIPTKIFTMDDYKTKS